MKRYGALMMLILLAFVRLSDAGDDLQYWSQLSLKPVKSEKLDIVLFSDARFMQDARKLGLYFVSPRIVYHHSKGLDLGINYTYLQSRTTVPFAADDSYDRQHRAELEANPQWPLTDWVKLKMRNRVEFRWIEDKGADNARFRQRWSFDVPVKNNGFLKSVYFNSELFYEFHSREFRENRTVPLGLNFKIADKVRLDLFYMVQSKKGTKDWSSNQAIGTLVSIDF